MRRDEAINDITSTWGSPQVIFGPVLIVPYKQTEKTFRDQLVNGRIERMEVSEEVRARAFFLPASFEVKGHLDPTRLHRGIYDAVVYGGTMTLSGSFARPAFDEWRIDPRQILWEESVLALSVTDLRGARESLQIKIGGKAIPMSPGTQLPGFAGGVHARLKDGWEQAEKIPFEMRLIFNGSQSLRFAPVGMNNDLRLTSAWPDPGFKGAFLPAEREVGPEGFQAHWQASYYGRSYPQQWIEKNPPAHEAVVASLFGVDLITIVDSYRYVERSIKYGVLMIAMLLASFFLFEVLSDVRIHPFQYTLVGFALCLFYLALLALSEVISFAAAYWTGAVAATLMISLYSTKVLHSGRRAMLIASGLPVVFGFLFVVLRLQDYALLIGTAGLLIVLALVMYLTRNINWYNR
jgi:inner membrane protein